MKVIGTVAPKATSGVKDKASRAERPQKDLILALLPFCWGMRCHPVLLCNVSILEPCLWFISSFLSGHYGGNDIPCEDMYKDLERNQESLDYISETVSTCVYIPAR